MGLEPQKFFVGLMDFFSILLPGALLTSNCWRAEVGLVMLGNRYAKLDGAQPWAVFLFTSYLFGDLVLLLGSWLDELNDWSRRYPLNPQVAPLSCALAGLGPPGANRQGAGGAGFGTAGPRTGGAFF